MHKLLAVGFVVIALSSSASQGAPSGPVQGMMDTPASAFDMFMFRLYESGKCKLWFGDSLDEPDACISSLRYNPDSNQLDIYFRAYATAEMLGDFVEVDDDQREIIMIEATNRMASIAGARDTWGMLHSVPVRHGWSTADVDEGAFRKALAARTAIHLSVSYGTKLFLATRGLDGDVLVDVRKTKG